MTHKRFFGALMMLSIFLGWHCGYEKTAPNDLVGIWETSAPKYADRFFKIDQDTITIGQGGDAFEIHVIKKIHAKKIPEERSILYTIYYENESVDDYKFAFYYSPENGGMIRLKHKKNIIWKKKNNR